MAKSYRKKLFPVIWILIPVMEKTGIGKITSDWGVLGLFQVADGLILALKNLCSGGNSHHRDFALGGAKF